MYYFSLLSPQHSFVLYMMLPRDIGFYTSERYCLALTITDLFNVYITMALLVTILAIT